VRTSFPNDREQARRWAQDLLTRADWAVLDTETTGLGSTAEVVQIAIVGADGTTVLDTLVRPIGLIPPDAVAVHGITNAMVDGAPSYPDVHPTLQAVLSGRLVVCYNAAFDRRILRQSALRNQTPELAARWECAMEQYSRYVGQWSPRYGHYTWQPLPRRPEYRSERHQAIVDCLATLDVIRKMAAG